MRRHRFLIFTSSLLFACSPAGTDPGGSGGAGMLGSGGAPANSGGAGTDSGSGGDNSTSPNSGGATGSGGAVGSGGDGAGATTSSGGSDVGASGGAQGGSDCSSLFLCDSFDDVAVGMAPDAARWQLELGWANDQTQAAKIQISSEQAHSGTNSVKLAGGDGAPFTFFTAPPGETFYTRAWMKMIASAGDGTLHAVGPNHNDSEIRFRLQAGKVTLNSAGGDGLNPEPTNCVDCVATPSDWFCVEMFYDGATESATLWIDDVQAASVVNNTGWHSSGQFGNSAVKVWFGTFWHNGSAPVTYIDDVAIHTSRIGCD